VGVKYQVAEGNERTPPGSAERQLGIGYENVMMGGGDPNSM